MIEPNRRTPPLSSVPLRPKPCAGGAWSRLQIAQNPLHFQPHTCSGRSPMAHLPRNIVALQWLKHGFSISA
jgi:hypothetical protein